MGAPDDSFVRRMCESAGVALIAADEHLRIRFWNRSASAIFGGSPESMAGESLLSIVPQGRRALAQRLFDRTLQRGEVAEFEFAHTSPAGAELQLAITLSPILAESGRALGISVYVRDSTRRIQLERQMADAQKMSALGSMAGAVAHHFNNLIGGIITSIDFALGSENPQALRRAVQGAVAGLNRASRLTLGLLAFAEGDRSESAGADLNQLVEQFARSLQPRLADEDIDLEMDLRPVGAVLPRRRMLTVLDNLVANACDAMPDGGVLRIELRPADGEAILKVHDTGVGINADDMSHVFEPFFTTKADSASPADHAGLGLAVVHGIVKELGGSVTLTSEPGEGTTCTLRLPCCVQRPPA